MSQSEIHNPQSAILVIGIGNEYCSDDAIGIVVARRIRGRNLPGVTVAEESGEGASLTELWRGKKTVIVVDAVSSGVKPGTIYRFDAVTQPIPAKFFQYSTHAFGVAGAIELARVMHHLPENLIVYGVEGKNFQAGTAISPGLDLAADEIVVQIVKECQSFGDRAEE